MRRVVLSHRFVKSIQLLFDTVATTGITKPHVCLAVFNCRFLCLKSVDPVRYIRAFLRHELTFPVGTENGLRPCR